MFDIYLFRHGDSEPWGPDGSDSSRALTARGKEDVRRAVRGLVRLGVKLDQILTSPLIRARETGEIAAEVLKPVQAPEVCDALGPGGTHAGLLSHISALGLSRLMLVGHLPDLPELASLFTWGAPDGNIALKKAGVIRIITEALPPAAKGELQWLLTAQQLSLIGEAG